MQRTIILTGVLLIIQIGLVFYANTTGERYEAFSPGGTLFTFSPESVSSITFTDGNEQQLALKKENGSWQLAVKSALPADESRVKQLLEKLAGLKESLAVANSKEAARRFKVSKDLFERHVLVKQGNEIAADIYIGTSPGIRHVHARVAGQESIMSLPLSSFDLSPTVENWINKKMLHVKEEDLQRITLADYSLAKKDDKWLLNEVSENQKVNSEEIKQLVDKLTGLNIQTVLDEEDITGAVVDEPRLRYTLMLKNNEKREYTFTKPDEEYYVLRVSGLEPYFKIGKWIVDDIAAITKDKLMEPDPSKEENEGEQHSS